LRHCIDYRRSQFPVNTPNTAGKGRSCGPAPPVYSPISGNQAQYGLTAPATFQPAQQME
jgi:hypothetical protein